MKTTIAKKPVIPESVRKELDSIDEKLKFLYQDSTNSRSMQRSIDERISHMDNFQWKLDQHERMFREKETEEHFKEKSKVKTVDILMYVAYILLIAAIALQLIKQLKKSSQ